ncbi:hypothetical protein ACFFNY_26775 [Paenibacillus hodogayensis]|uniref:Uncharacterized protein n=1 Tax=Paenibacillus hodogayensis TaxID=279208 RepID=A0ABV5W3P4_9BACL
MTHPHYPLLVYGATSAGLGLTVAAPAGTLLVERSSLVGHEFVAAYNPGHRWERRLDSAAAELLRTELLERGLLTPEGRVHLPAIAPVLFRLIRQHCLHVQMMTEIVEVVPDRNGYAVTLLNASGLTRVTAGRLIDTTPLCSSLGARRMTPIAKSINAMLHAPGTAELPPSPLPEPLDGRVSLLDGLYPGERILRLELDAGDGWLTAREKLHRYWADHYTAFAPWTIAALADAFDIRTTELDRDIADRWSWFPSSSYANLLEAYDAGYTKGCLLHETTVSA